MAEKKDVLSWLRFSRLEWLAILSATILSISCLAKGAVHDSVVALLLLSALPLLYHALRHQVSPHRGLVTAGIVVFGSMLCILALQYVTGTITDHGAWMQSIGRIIFCIVIFVIALIIGTQHAVSRLFFESLLLSSAVCVAVTFFIATEQGVPSTTFYSYTHGFVNPNNAANYLGILLLLALAQAVRFFRVPAKTFLRMFIEIIDQLSMTTILKAGLVLFSILLALAGLFMTGSRGGLLVSLLCSVLFFITVLFKMNLHSRTRKGVIIIAMLGMGVLFAWSFSNFGHVTVNKIELQGINTNSRLDIMSAVLPMLKDHPFLGVGAGNFAGIFQQYRPQNVSSDGIIDKAHNSYLEFAAEMGIPALLIVLTALGWAGYTLYCGVRDHKEYYITPAMGLMVWLLAGLHSLIDFPLQIPGILAIFIAIITIAVSQTDRQFIASGHEHAPIKRIRTRRRRTSSRNI